MRHTHESEYMSTGKTVDKTARDLYDQCDEPLLTVIIRG